MPSAALLRRVETDRVVASRQDDHYRALSGDDQRRQRSLAWSGVSGKRRGCAKTNSRRLSRFVMIVPDTISVGEFANRMAERTADVVKELMKLGVMATAADH